EANRERDEMLLGAVMDVPLKPPPFGVLRRDDPLPRLLQVVGLRRQVAEAGGQQFAELGVAQRHTRLDGEVLDETVLDGRRGGPGR
nr:hypothetical protein [Micromonospora sp. DSM 115978]